MPFQVQLPLKKQQKQLMIRGLFSFAFELAPDHGLTCLGHSLGSQNFKNAIILIKNRYRMTFEYLFVSPSRARLQFRTNLHLQFPSRLPITVARCHKRFRSEGALLIAAR